MTTQSEVKRGPRGTFVKGHAKYPGSGTLKGQPRKTTLALKEALLLAAEKAGDGDMVAYLTKMALEQPSSFLALLGKVLPLQLQGDGNPITLRRIEYVIIDPRRPDEPIPLLTHDNQDETKQ